MRDYGEDLIAELKGSLSWPLPRERRYRSLVADRRALRRGEKSALKILSRWSRHDTADGLERDYVVDPLARRIAGGFADFLFAEDPKFTHPDHQDDLDHLVVENRMAAGLHRAERTVASEGESWWKIHTNPEISDVALLEWRSRLSVVPLFYGDRLLACAFVSEVCRESDGDEENPSERVYRHAEVHCDKVVRNLLFVGTHDQLGSPVQLEDRPETRETLEEWRHDLPMLAGRVVNDLDDDDELGQGEYDQVQDLLLALNEAITIGTENARLTGQDRIFTDARFTRQDGSFDASLQVFQSNSPGDTLGEGSERPPVVAIEKHYDAEPLWLHITKIVHTILSRVGLVAKFIGDIEDGGNDASGRSIRLQFMPTTNAAKGKAREWDATLPRLTDLMLKVGALPRDNGGFGRAYDTQELPSVERGDVLPVDEGETVVDNATAVTAEIRSRYVAVKEQHPDWTEDEIEAELARISQDTQLLPALPPADEQ